MTIISPSLLSSNFADLTNEIKALGSDENTWIHLDIMDGHFVPNLTFGPPVISSIKKITNLKLDAHLMVTNPEDYIQPLAKIGIYNFTFHWEAVIHHDRIIQEAKKHFKSIGISLNPSTNINVIPDYILHEIDLILIMSVNPGFGGQSFIANTCKKVQALTLKLESIGKKAMIQVDGGINDKNAHALIHEGANNLVAGSYIFETTQDKYTDKIKSLRLG